MSRISDWSRHTIREFLVNCVCRGLGCQTPRWPVRGDSVQNSRPRNGP